MPIYTVGGTVKDAAGAAISGVSVRVYSRAGGALLASDVSSDGNPVAGDPYFSNVVLLSGYENGLADASTYAHPLTGTGSISTTGGAVGSAKSFAGYYVAPTSPAFALPGDFTFETEFWVNAWTPGLQGLIGIASYGNFMLRLQSSIVEIWMAGTNNVNLLGGATIPTGAWHHLAVTRQSGVVRVWFNGVKCGADISNTYSVLAGAPLVGASIHTPTSEYLNGRMDETRLTKGVARYSAPFARPTSPHKAYANKAAIPFGTYSIPLGSTDPGEVQVVFLDADGDPLQNDVIQRAYPIAI